MRLTMVDLRKRALSISVHGGIERHKVSRHGRRSCRVGRKRSRTFEFHSARLTSYEAEAAKGEGVLPRAPSVFFSSRRCRLACTKPRKSGWAFVGLDLNSGWHCTATNQG